MRGPPAPRQSEGAAGSHEGIPVGSRKGIPGGAHEGQAVEGIVELIAVAVGRNQLRCQCEIRHVLNINVGVYVSVPFTTVVENQ